MLPAFQSYIMATVNILQDELDKAIVSSVLGNSVARGQNSRPRETNPRADEGNFMPGEAKWGTRHCKSQQADDRARTLRLRVREASAWGRQTEAALSRSKSLCAAAARGLGPRTRFKTAAIDARAQPYCLAKPQGRQPPRGRVGRGVPSNHSVGPCKYRRRAL
jgi:hypothetical protein